MPADLCQQQHPLLPPRAGPAPLGKFCKVCPRHPPQSPARLSWSQSQGLAQGVRRKAPSGRRMGWECPAPPEHRCGHLLALAASLLLTCGPGKQGWAGTRSREIPEERGWGLLELPVGQPGLLLARGQMTHSPPQAAFCEWTRWSSQKGCRVRCMPRGSGRRCPGIPPGLAHSPPHTRGVLLTPWLPAPAPSSGGGMSRSQEPPSRGDTEEDSLPTLGGSGIVTGD